MALDDSFSWQSMALALQIPTQNSHARTILEREFNTLLEVGLWDNGRMEVINYHFSWGQTEILVMGNTLLDMSGLLMKEKRVDSVILNEVRRQQAGSDWFYLMGILVSEALD